MKPISIFDGRYRKACENLTNFFTEENFIQTRYQIEIKWLKCLIDNLYPHTNRFELLEEIEKLPKYLTYEQIQDIKEIEKKTKHDVKAIELYIKQQITNLGLHIPQEWVHMCLTSQDVNSPAQSIILLNGVYSLSFHIKDICDEFISKYKEWGHIPMLAFTHGQPAIPTTLNKELGFHMNRILKTADIHIFDKQITYKLCGAIGSWASGKYAFPEINNFEWSIILKSFLNNHVVIGHKDTLGHIDIKTVKENLKNGITMYPLGITNENEDYWDLGWSEIGTTTQTDDYSSYYRIINELILLMRQIRVFTDYIRCLIHDEYLVQVPVSTETGSSTMPQKVNPIHFENIKANSELAISVLRSIGDTIMMGEYQRDMSDSTALRSLSTAFGYIGIVIYNLRDGLSRIHPNKEYIASELNRHPEVIMEAVQTVCRRYNINSAYETAKEFSRGNREMTLENIRNEYIDKIEGLPDAEKERLMKLTPSNYLGLLDNQSIIIHNNIITL